MHVFQVVARHAPRNGDRRDCIAPSNRESLPIHMVRYLDSTRLRGLRLSRSRVSLSDPSGSAERQPSEISWQTRPVSTFLLSGTATGPRSSGDVRSDPQPHAEVQGQGTIPSLSPLSRPVNLREFRLKIFDLSIKPH
jgi:hypothetical protein